MTSRIALSLFLVACSSGRAATHDEGSTAPIAGRPASALSSHRIVTFEGMCDASGAVPLNSRMFAVADDESNVLRVYDANKGGPPVHSVDVTPELRMKKKKNPEADLEAATQIGKYALWVSSHARSKKGKEKPDRLRYFATTMPVPGKNVRLEGQAYTGLLEDLLADPRLARFNLAAAAERSPQEEGGLNLEGMTAKPSGSVLLGFRNPVPEGKALLVEIMNPLEPMYGKRARFGEPVLLDLGGLGVRSLSYWRGRYVIAAGHYDNGAVSRVFTWAGDDTPPRPFPAPALDDFNPEGLFTPEDRDEMMLLSDDGSRTIAGERCKDLKDHEDMRFRGMWLRGDW